MNWKTSFFKGLRCSTEGNNLFYTLTLSLLSYVFITLISVPSYTLQTLQLGLIHLPGTLKMLTIANLGSPRFVLSIIYSVFLGVILTNIAISVSTAKLDLRKLMGLLPGIAAAGCGSCGIGLIAFVGFAGALSFLPYGGVELYLVGIVFLMYSIADIGDPRECSL